MQASGELEQLREHRAALEAQHAAAQHARAKAEQAAAQLEEQRLRIRDEAERAQARPNLAGRTRLEMGCR